MRIHPCAAGFFTQGLGVEYPLLREFSVHVVHPVLPSFFRIGRILSASPTATIRMFGKNQAGG
jgi:hypothetical protein